MANEIAQQFLVMYTKMGSEGLEMVPLEQQFNDLDLARKAADKFGNWQILEISARVVLASAMEKA